MQTNTFQTAEPWGTEEERQARYDAELIRRYVEGLPLTKLDAKNARRLIKAGKPQVSA